MSLLDNFPHRCTLQKRIRSSDAFGGNLDTVQVVSTDVECWQQAASDREVKSFEKRGISVSFKVYFVSDPLVTEQYQLIITERDGSAVPVASQVILDVKSAAEPDASAGKGVVYRVMCDYQTGEIQ